MPYRPDELDDGSCPDSHRFASVLHQWAAAVPAALACGRLTATDHARRELLDLCVDNG